MKKTYPHFSNKPYRKRPFGEPKDKWDHEGYDALMQESTRSEYSPQNYYFKKKKDEGYSYRKEDQNFSRPLFKSEPQVLKCYTKKVEKPPQVESGPQNEKNEKNDDKENAALDEKLSNVSTSFSSKEKPAEEELTTPVLHTHKRAETQTEVQPIFQMNIILPNETKSLEIFKEDEAEDKINEVSLTHKDRDLEFFTLRICIAHQIKTEGIFSETFAKKLLEKFVEAYEKWKESSIGKIDEVNDED